MWVGLFHSYRVEDTRTDEKAEPNNILLPESYLNCNDSHKIKIRTWGKICSASGELRKAGVIIMKSDKATIKIDLLKRSKKNKLYLKPLQTMNCYQNLIYVQITSKYSKEKIFNL